MWARSLLTFAHLSIYPAEKWNTVIALQRIGMSIIGALIISVLLAISFATVAHAATTESPTPVLTAADSFLTYTGVTTLTSADGDVEAYDDGIFGADCSSGTCLLWNYDSQDRFPRVEVIDGRASFEVPPLGDSCSDGYEPGISTTVTFEGTSATLTQVFHWPTSEACPLMYGGGLFSTSVIDGKLQTGNPCFLNDTCPKSDPTVTPTAEAIVVPVLPVAPSRALDEPSILSALPTTTTAITVRNVLWATAMAVILALLVAFPKHLLSSAASTGSKRLATWGEKLATTAGEPWKRLRAFVGRITTVKGWGAATIGIAVAAVISSFVDPEFGWNAASIRTAISILVSLAVQIVTGWLLLIWLVRRTHPSAKAEFEFRPLTLFIVVGAVVLSRLTEFAPGIIFGLVAGLSFGALTATAERARVALIGLARAFVLSLLAWFGYSLMAPIVDGGPVVVFITETFSSLAIAGIVALPIALIPFRGTTGDLLWKWNRWTWVGAYVVGFIGFFLILMPMPFSWKEVPVSLATWVGLFIAYAVGSLILWAIIVRPWEKEEATDRLATGAVAHEAISEEAG